jgi:hypothetical protein
VSYGWGKSQLRRQGSKAKDQHGRGLDNLQKQDGVGKQERKSRRVYGVSGTRFKMTKWCIQEETRLKN